MLFLRRHYAIYIHVDIYIGLALKAQGFIDWTSALYSYYVTMCDVEMVSCSNSVSAGIESQVSLTTLVGTSSSPVDATGGSTQEDNNAGITSLQGTCNEFAVSVEPF